MPALNTGPGEAREQLGLSAAFRIFEASQVLELYTGFGLFHIPLPVGEFLVGMVDPTGIRRFGIVRFSGLHDHDQWYDG